MKDNNDSAEKKDTTVKVNSYLIDFFDSIPNTIKGKNNKIIDILLNNNIKAEDYPNNKITLHIYTSEDIDEKLKIKQEECGFPNFSHFVNANLRKFYDDRHEYNHKMIDRRSILKPKVNFAKFKHLIKKCKKNLIDGEYASYDNSAKRCCLSEPQLRQEEADYKERKMDDALIPNCYSELSQTARWNIKCDCLEASVLSYIRKYSVGTWASEYIDNYHDLIGLNNNNFKEYSNKIIEANNIQMKKEYDSDKDEEYLVYPDVLEKLNKHTLKYYDFEIPDIDTYFYLWIYYIYQENETYSNVNFRFNTDDKYAEKLLEKYTIDNIICHYLKLDEELLINNIFDDEIVDYLNDNELINLSDLYQKNIQNI